MSRRSDDELAEAWHDLMGRYHRALCSLDRELSSQHDISASEFEILQQLHNAAPSDCGMRLHELGERVHLTQSALSRLIARLERDGLVQRQMCPDDRRSVIATITDDGLTRYESAKPTQRAILREQAVAAGRA
ncbi:MAG TPA: MarR family transcriptional regulator [Jatrophihabitantaceae bacterium]